jgi:NTP pyrophosphatase (non-canonical NTP hydrolase)
MIPLAGLASETGELLGQYKTFLRDKNSHRLFRERLAEEVGDLLWYVATVATKFDLDLAECAEQNLGKCEARWKPREEATSFDAGFPDHERIPRRFSIEFVSCREEGGARTVRVLHEGKPFGDELTDNAYQGDGYGYHDVLHLAFAAVLGWSPLVRKMLGAKRRSSPKIDEVEDGGRAIAIEEGITAVVFAYARDYDFLDGKASVSSELLRMIKNMVSHLEVAACIPGDWERAIVLGLQVWREVNTADGGTVELDLDRRTLSLHTT